MLSFRPAKISDLITLVKMLSDDQLGIKRENYSLPLDDGYITAFEIIDNDPNNELIVAELDNQIIGMLQLTFIPYLTHQGSWRCLIEGVRVHENFRGQGFGTQLFEWAIERAKQQGCKIVQLTSNKQRSTAIKFYQRLGFEASHEGLKLYL